MKIMLIKKGCPIPQGFTTHLFEVADGKMLDRCAAICMRRMIYQAMQCGIKIRVLSAYRSPKRQSELIEEEVRALMSRGMCRKAALDRTMRTLAAPNESEHNAGLAADLAGKDSEFELVTDFDTTKEFAWLCRNAHKFGYILRYPKGKCDITGIDYEPWHFRYVGAPHAEIIKARNLTLEEYLEFAKQ